MKKQNLSCYPTFTKLAYKRPTVF